MSELIPLAIFPRKPTGKILDMVKAAKHSLNMKQMVQPCDAVPGSPGRVLAIGSKPDFICDYAYVANPTVESLTSALAWCFGLREDPRGVTMGRMLSEIFGGEVKEL